MGIESYFERALMNELNCYYSFEVDDIDFTSADFLQEVLPAAAKNSGKRLRAAVGDPSSHAFATYLDELAANRAHDFFARLGDEIFDVSEDRDWNALQRILSAIADAMRHST